MSTESFQAGVRNGCRRAKCQGRICAEGVGEIRRSGTGTGRKLQRLRPPMIPSHSAVEHRPAVCEVVLVLEELDQFRATSADPHFNRPVRTNLERVAGFSEPVQGREVSKPGQSLFEVQ